MEGTKHRAGSKISPGTAPRIENPSSWRGKKQGQRRKGASLRFLSAAGLLGGVCVFINEIQAASLLIITLFPPGG
jgi:hypothetical protein